MKQVNSVRLSAPASLRDWRLVIETGNIPTLYGQVYPSSLRAPATFQGSWEIHRPYNLGSQVYLGGEMFTCVRAGTSSSIIPLIDADAVEVMDGTVLWRRNSGTRENRLPDSEQMRRLGIFRVT